MVRNENVKTRCFALNMLKVSVAIFGAALLFACGDDDSSFGTSAKGGSAAEADIVVTIFDDLPNCTGKREGKTAFVKEENATYVCTDGEWGVAGETLDEGDDDGDDADKKSSSSTAKSADSKAKSSSSVESSSSVIPGSDPESSSSEGVGDASSSSVIASSSSEEQAGSSSSDELSSSSRGLFEMSKDEFLNPKVSYGEMTDTRDNKTYKTVKIGDQVWMAENLNYDYNKGTAKSYCFGDNEVNCAVTGRLYTWAAAIDSVALANDADNPQTCGYGKTCTLPTVVQGVCPEGWHLPSYDEWETLFTAVGGSSKAGMALKSQTGWKSQTGDAADRDAYGFSALPAGYRFSNGNFYDAGSLAYFWSASELSSYIAYYMRLYYDDESVDMDDFSKGIGFSVRCLQN